MKIGMALSRMDLDAPLAEHFGKAKWLLVLEPPETFEFIRNQGLNGRWAAETLAGRGCGDVVAGRLGPGALAHVEAAGMRAWQAEPGLSAREAAWKLAEGALQPLREAHRHGGSEALVNLPAARGC